MLGTPTNVDEAKKKHLEADIHQKIEAKRQDPYTMPDQLKAFSNDLVQIEGEQRYFCLRCVIQIASAPTKILRHFQSKYFLCA